MQYTERLGLVPSVYLKLFKAIPNTKNWSKRQRAQFIQDYVINRLPEDKMDAIFDQTIMGTNRNNFISALDGMVECKIPLDVEVLVELFDRIDH